MQMHGKFFWYDVMTTDPAAARRFYASVVGWGAQDSGVGDADYTVLTVSGQGVAGLMPIPEDSRAAGVPPTWMGYIEADDVDAVAARIVELGGTVQKPPADVPGVIRFAVVADPQGAGFLIAKGLMEGGPPPLPPMTPGTISWHELYAADWEQVFPFYEKLFGWVKKEAIDMGPMGTYQLFATPGSDEAVGGMMTKPQEVPAPFWGYYIGVPNIDTAVERVKAGGGRVINGPMEVPGGAWIVQAIDPQGAYFALVGPKG
jgi:predicted enzyme related to lactoylglutathione lyase